MLVCGRVDRVTGRAVRELDWVCVPVLWPRVERLETDVWSDGLAVDGLDPGAVAGPSVAAVMEAAACVVLAVGSVRGVGVVAGGVLSVAACRVAPDAAVACAVGFSEGEFVATV